MMVSYLCNVTRPGWHWAKIILIGKASKLGRIIYWDKAPFTSRKHKIEHTHHVVRNISLQLEASSV